MNAREIVASSFARAFAELAGDRWGFLLILGAFNGNRRFQDWQRSAGFAPSVLAQRLKHMVEAGILWQQPLADGSDRSEYRLTEKGRDLQPWALAVWDWERCWHGPADASVDRFTVLTHRPCGHATTPVFACSCCGETLKVQDVDWEPGPGLQDINHLAQLTSRHARNASARQPMKFAGGAFDMIGERWTFALLVALFQGSRRFGELQAALQLAPSILAERLRRMGDDGLLAGQPQHAGTDRNAYQLTDKGRALFPLFLGLTWWGDRWLSGRAGVPHRMVHTRCGAQASLVVRCEHCALPLAPSDMATRVIQGAELARYRRGARAAA